MGAPGIGVDIAAAPRGREFGRRQFAVLTFVIVRVLAPFAQALSPDMLG